MTKEEKKVIAEAMLPFIVLVAQIKWKPYREMTPDFQESLVQSVGKINKVLFKEDGTEKS